MLTNLILLFTIIPALELVVLIKVGAQIGAINTVLIIILTGVTGATLARMQGFIVLSRIQESIAKGEMPSNELLDGVMILIGGILLLTPGFITDIMGFLLLIPLTRSLIKKGVQHHIKTLIEKGEIIRINENRRNDSYYDDIDIN